jgi:hypothetical protein
VAEDIDRFVAALDDIWNELDLKRADEEAGDAKEAVSRIY